MNKIHSFRRNIWEPTPLEGEKEFKEYNHKGLQRGAIE
jgi:hypothetical protein